MQDDTDTLLVEVGVELVQWLTIERKIERGKRVQDRDGLKEVDRDHQAYIHTTMMSLLFLSSLMVGCGATRKDTDQRHVRILERFS